jgi:nucleotide-binding universal stress UspA family protein
MQTSPSVPRILVPLNDSIQAQRVLGYVRALAIRSQAQVKLLRATDIEDDTSFNSLASNAARLKDDGVAVEWNVAKGVDASTAIDNEAATWQPDLVAMTSRSQSAVDRWLNGSVTDQVIKSVTVPLLVIPPNWQAPAWHERPVRILVPLDGSQFAEQMLGPAVRLALLLSGELILLRVVEAEAAENGASVYLRRLAAESESVFPDGRVSWRVVTGSPVKAITQAALDLDADAIAMAARGRGGLARVVSGDTATGVLEQSQVPLLFVGARAVVEPASTELKLRSEVRTRDNRRAGEVHRVVVDLEQHAVISIVVVGRDQLARDVLIPIDFIERLDNSEVRLRLTGEEVDTLPDFAYHEFVTPPSTWTSIPVPAEEHTRIGPHQLAITPETRLVALDGMIGHVDGVELNLETGALVALRSREVRIPAEYVQTSGKEDTLQVPAKLADVDGFLGQNRRHVRIG